MKKNVCLENQHLHVNQVSNNSSVQTSFYGRHCHKSFLTLCEIFSLNCLNLNLMGMALSCIWCWGSSVGSLWSMKYHTLLPLLPCPLWTGIVISVKILFMNQINLFKNFIHLIGQCEKKKLLRNIYKKL